MQSEESQAVLKKATASQKADSNGIKNWRPLEDRDWYSEEKMEVSDTSMENQLETGTSHGSPDVNAILTRFKEKYPNLKAELEENAHRIKVRLGQHASLCRV
jgi:hypothetical protein